VHIPLDLNLTAVINTMCRPIDHTCGPDHQTLHLG